MYPGKHAYTEAAHIGEELFDDPAYEVEQNCERIQRGVERGIFDVPGGLQAYKVLQSDYDKYLGEHLAEQLVTAVSLSTATAGYTSYIHVINYMMESFAHSSPVFSSHSKSPEPALRALKKLSKEAEEKKFHFGG
jgi:hypothetical protein